MADRRREIAQLMRDREHEGRGFIDFWEDTVDWDGIVDAIAEALGQPPAVEHREWDGTHYRSIRPDGTMWCESKNPREVIESAEGEGWQFERLDYYRVTAGWQPWTPEVTRAPDADPKLSEADSTP